MQNDLFVQPKRTYISENDLIESIKFAFKNLFNQPIETKTLAVLWAHFSFECGRGKICYNWNVGNIKRLPNKMWTWYKCNEIINKKTVWFEPPHPQTHFCAYNNLNESVIEHLNFLIKIKYKKVFDAALQGDASLYCHELKNVDYYSAGEKIYTAGVVSLTKEFLRKYGNEDGNENETTLVSPYDEFIDKPISEIKVVLPEEKKSWLKPFFNMFDFLHK